MTLTTNESAAVPPVRWMPSWPVRLATWLTSWGVRPAPAAVRSGEPDAMLASFLSVLDVRTRRATLSVTDEAKKAVLAEIQTSLNTFKDRFAVASRDDAQAWNECYRLERLMALIEPAENLWPELQRRVAEAADEKLTSALRLAAAADAARQLAFDAQAPHGLRPGGEELLRSNLLDVLEEIHWAVHRKFYSRPIRKSASRRIVGTGMLAFLLFIMPYIVLYWFALTGRNPVEGWSWLPFYTALTSGLFGALFSRLLFLQSNWDNLTIGGLKVARDYTSIFLRGCVGMTGAVIVSFFLLSNVVGGGLFPIFSEIGLDTTSYPKVEGSVPHLSLIYPSKSLALLVVWSFLAGFSERLIPSLLQDTEASIAKRAASK